MTRPPHRRTRTALVLGLTAVTAAAAVVGLIGFEAQLSFFGVGSDEAFQQWTHLPLLVAGASAWVVAVAGLTLVHIDRLPHTRSAAVAATAGALVVLAVGGWSYHSRTHPHGFERSAIARLSVPPVSVRDLTSYGSTPEDTSPTASAPQFGPPVAVRSWGPTNCAALHQVLSEWADRGSVHAPPPLAAAPPCFWDARYHGWDVVGSILNSQTSGTARVVISPPTV